MTDEMVRRWYEDARSLCISRNIEVAGEWEDLHPTHQQFIRDLYSDNATFMNRMIVPMEI